MRPLELAWDPGAVVPRLELFRTPGAYAAVVRGRLLSAGACPLDDGGVVVAVGDVAGQAAVVMDHLGTALRTSGCGLGDVVKVTVYVASTDRLDLSAVGRVVRERFGDHDPPSTLLGVAQLGHPNQLVEVEAFAVAP